MVFANCSLCGKEFIDSHSGRKGLKFCCRQHFREYKQKHGTWNKGKKWKEMYSSETLTIMNARIVAKGKDHFNYNKTRKDVLVRNILDNENFSDKKKQEIKELIKENGFEKAVAELISKSVSRKDKKEYNAKWKNYRNSYRNNRRATDEPYRLKENLRSRLWSAFKAYSTTGKLRKADEYGIDYKAIIEHLGPMPDGDFQIDHIIPLSRFDFNDLAQIKIAFSPENHQWLSAEENLKKGNKLFTPKV